MHADAAVAAAAWLRDATHGLDAGPPVTWTYHPLTYAWAPHEAYLRRFAATPKRALLVGMNPGPWGMGQVGIPFGEVGLVGDWLGLRGAPVGTPDRVHPKRPVEGWACTRAEKSGERLWGLLQAEYGPAERALRDLLVINHCPLLMFDDAGRNITPDKLRAAHRDEVLTVCDEGVARMVRATGATVLIGVGAYAKERCQAVVDGTGLKVDVFSIPHPSPASPLANRNGGADWRAAVRATLADAGVGPDEAPSPP